MKYQFGLINQFILPKWQRILGFSRNVQSKVLEDPIQEGDEWVYSVKFISCTTKWLWFTIKVTKL